MSRGEFGILRLVARRGEAILGVRLGEAILTLGLRGESQLRLARLASNRLVLISVCILCIVLTMPNEGGGVSGHLDFSHNSKVNKFPLKASSRREMCQQHQSCILNPNPCTPDSESPPISDEHEEREIATFSQIARHEQVEYCF
jgi:hypothetical protein